MSPNDSSNRLHEPSTRAPRRSDQDVEDALRQSAGNLTSARLKLEMTRWGLSKRINSSSYLQRVLAEVNEDVIDTAEAGVVRRLQKGDQRTEEMILKTKGRKRGWGTGRESAPAPAPYVLDLSKLSDARFDRLCKVLELPEIDDGAA